MSHTTVFNSKDKSIIWKNMLESPIKKKPRPTGRKIYEDNPYIVNVSKKRVEWKDELEQRFFVVTTVLGSDNFPSDILYHMNVTGVTCKQVASHLQKLRLREKVTTSNEVPVLAHTLLLR